MTFATTSSCVRDAQARALRRGARAACWWLPLALLAGGCKSPETTGTPTGGNNLAPVATSATVAPAAPYTGTSLKIGHYASITGAQATFGTSTDNGIKMAAKEINAHGGVLGKQLEIVTEDDGSVTAQVASVVTRLLQQDDVLLVMGEVASSRSLVGATLCQAAQVPMVTPSSTNPDVTKKGDYIFRTCFTDPFQGTVMSRFAAGTLHAHTAAILTDETNDYSKGLTQFFGADFEKSGGKVVAATTYRQDDKDFRAQLTQIREQNPDVIYIPGYYDQIGNIARQARSLGITQPMLGGDGWDSPQLFTIGGSAVNGCYFSNHYSSQSRNPRVVKFVAAYEALYGQVPDSLAAVAYDATYIVKDAIARAGSVDRQKIRDALAATRDYPGVTGTTTIGPDRNAKKPIAILKIVDGKQQFVKTVNPYS